MQVATSELTWSETGRIKEKKETKEKKRIIELEFPKVGSKFFCEIIHIFKQYSLNKYFKNTGHEECNMLDDSSWWHLLMIIDIIPCGVSRHLAGHVILIHNRLFLGLMLKYFKICRKE